MRPCRGDMVVSKWGARFAGRRFVCSIGRGGISPEKHEGDGASPSGVWHLVGGMYRADRGVVFGLKPAGHSDLWSDDPQDVAYNHHVRGPAYPHSHEALRRADRLYDIVLFSDWNWPDSQPGKGSAIFVHLWRRPRYPTAGCIAFSRPDLEWIMARWRPRSRIFVQP